MLHPALHKSLNLVLPVLIVALIAENIILLRQAARVRRLGAVGVQDLAMSVGNPGSLELRDARGRAFELVQPVVPRRVNFNGAVMARELEFTFRPRPDQGPADKLILPGSRPTVIAAPFTLTNVKLP